MRPEISRTRRQHLSAGLLGCAGVALVAVLLWTMSAVFAFVFFAGSAVFFPWRGSGRHARPRKPVAAIAPVRQSQENPRPAVKTFLDPYAETTTELPLPTPLRQGEAQ